MDATVVPGHHGRSVVPAKVRTAFDLSTDAAVVELRTLAQDLPLFRSLVDELLADRRAETTQD